MVVNIWWTVTGQGVGDGVTGDTEFGGDGTFGELFAVIEVPDQCPVFHGDHPFNLGWVV